MSSVLFIASGSYLHTESNDNQVFDETYTHLALILVFAIDSASSLTMTMYGGWFHQGLARSVLWMLYLLDIGLTNRALMPYVDSYGCVINVKFFKIVTVIYTGLIIVYSVYSHFDDDD